MDKKKLLIIYEPISIVQQSFLNLDMAHKECVSAEDLKEWQLLKLMIQHF